MRRSPLLAALALLAAGCAAAPEPAADDAALAAGAPADWALRALPAGEAHDHLDPLQHQGRSTPNFELLGWDPLSTDRYGMSAGGYLCGEGATTSEGRRLAVVNSINTDVAFVVVDVTDPAAPRKLSEYTVPRFMTYDVGLTPDGAHVVVGVVPLPRNRDPAAEAAALPLPSSAPLEVRVRSACTGEEQVLEGPAEGIPWGPGVLLLSLADPEAPTFEDFAPTPYLGPHSMSTAQVGERTYVVASITNLQQAISYANVYEVVETPVGGKLVLLTSVNAQQYGDLVAVDGIQNNGHVEGQVGLHPGSGLPILALSNWDAGLVLLDLSEPRAPRLLDTWNDDQVDGGAIHGAYFVPEMWDGRAVLLVGQEIGRRPADRPTGWTYVLDITDPADIREIGRWTLPVDPDPEWRSFHFSPHYVTTQGRTAFVSSYHGGLWAVDLSTLDAPDGERLEPATLGVFLPANVPEKAPRLAQSEAYPLVLDVWSFGDTLVVFEQSSGAYVVRFDPTRPAPAIPPWPASGKAQEG